MYDLGLNQLFSKPYEVRKISKNNQVHFLFIKISLFPHYLIVSKVQAVSDMLIQ